MEIGGNFIKFTAIGVYIEDAAVPALAKRWAGKTADELAADNAFFRDVVTGKIDRDARVAPALASHVSRCGVLWLTMNSLLLYGPCN